MRVRPVSPPGEEESGRAEGITPVPTFPPVICVTLGSDSAIPGCRSAAPMGSGGPPGQDRGSRPGRRRPPVRRPRGRAGDLVAEAHPRVRRRLAAGHRIEDPRACPAATVRHLAAAPVRERAAGTPPGRGGGEAADPAPRAAETDRMRGLLARLPARWARALGLGAVALRGRGAAAPARTRWRPGRAPASGARGAVRPGGGRAATAAGGGRPDRSAGPRAGPATSARPQWDARHRGVPRRPAGLREGLGWAGSTTARRPRGKGRTWALTCDDPVRRP